jgi:catalase
MDLFCDKPIYPSLEPQDCLMTTNQGALVYDNLHSLKAGARGPILIEDQIFREKMGHFDRERIPERIVHARGSGAHGVFESYDNWGELTKAKFLSEKGKITPVFVRFSQVAGFRGSADTVRDVRGFAVKFYTEDGNYDLVANNIPVFFIQDPTRFPDIIHALQPEPHHEMPQATGAHDNFWDFISLTPSTAHMLMWLLSPIGVASSYRKMNGAGVNTFKMVTDDGKYRFVKFHLLSTQGLESLVWDEAVKLQGKDSDHLRRDLWESIDKGQYPSWELAVQVMDPKDELKQDFDPLDPTKIWPVCQFPMIKLGKLTLDRNPINFFAEVEQAAFHPGNIVPGIDFSDDPILQGRLFSYLDTQFYRVGTNFQEIPINRPLKAANNNQQNGFARISVEPARKTNYYPNTRSRGCPFTTADLRGNLHLVKALQEQSLTTVPVKVRGDKVRALSRSFEDHFSQARERWLLFQDWEREYTIESAVDELNGVSEQYIVDNVINNIFSKIDEGFASEVKRRIKPKYDEAGHRINPQVKGRLPNPTHHT